MSPGGRWHRIYLKANEFIFWKCCKTWVVVYHGCFYDLRITFQKKSNTTGQQLNFFRRWLQNTECFVPSLWLMSNFISSQQLYRFESVDLYYERRHQPTSTDWLCTTECSLFEELCFACRLKYAAEVISCSPHCWKISICCTLSFVVVTERIERAAVHALSIVHKIKTNRMLRRMRWMTNMWCPFRP